MRLDTADTPQSSLKTATEFWKREEGKEKKTIAFYFTVDRRWCRKDFKISMKSFQLPNLRFTDISFHTLSIVVSESSIF